MTGIADLDRRFLPTEKWGEPEEQAERSYLSALVGESVLLRWSDLLSRDVVVILGEPGSGKTKEFEFQLARLRAESKYAFLLPLDGLAQRPFLQVLRADDRSRYLAWKKDSEPAFFFFDSVDEAKLKRSTDLLTALDHIQEAITASDLQRAHLLFSSRISEWRPTTDLLEIQNRFCVLCPSRPASLTREEANFRPLPLVVSLMPLDKERVVRYAKFCGLKAPEEFVAALDERQSWDFARRPLDIRGLFDYWLLHGRLGRLVETIEANVTLSLCESQPRQQNDPLPPLKARQGAESLAAATILCRCPRFKIPDDAHVPDLPALVPEECLPPDWLPKERQALVGRALFQGAAFGYIRFHHRRIIEYLAACWLTARVQDGCALERIEGLLFERREGTLVLRPSLAPTAAWLAIGDEPHNRLIRDLLLEAAPEVFLKYGDPETLPLDYKRLLLQAISGRCREAERWWGDYEVETLKRLSNPMLAAEVSAMIGDRSLARDFRSALLELVRHSRLAPCLEAVLSIFADPLEHADLKCHALAALRDIPDHMAREELLGLLEDLKDIPSLQAGLLCETLFPDFLSADKMAEMLRKSMPPSADIGDLPWMLRHHFQECVTSSLAGDLLGALLDLLHTEPHLAPSASETPVSQRFHWLTEVLPPILSKLLEKDHLEPRELRNAIEAVRILDDRILDLGILDRQTLQGVQSALNKQCAVKCACLWDEVARFRSQHKKEATNIQQVLFSRELLSLDKEDVSWLARDALGKEDSADRLIALRFALDLWRPGIKSWGDWLLLWRVASSSQELHRLFWRCTGQRLLIRPRAFWTRNVAWKLLAPHWWHRLRLRARRATEWVQSQWNLHRHLRCLYEGTAAGWLFSLAHESGGPGSADRWAAQDWSNLRRRRGPLIAWAARRGCEVAWKHHIPSFPHERSSPSRTACETVVGLCGLQSLWAQGRLDFHLLSDEDAYLAVRYATRELNGFPDWFPELARTKPLTVKRALEECIEGEWNYPAEREHGYEVLSRLAWQGQEYWLLIGGALLRRLREGNPTNPEILRYSLAIIVGIERPPFAKLAEVAALKVKDCNPQDRFLHMWLALWLQIESVAAIEALECLLARVPSSQDADSLVLRICASLMGDRFMPVRAHSQPDYLKPGILKKLIPIVYRHIRPTEDIDRRGGGAYSPTTRDEVQHFRDGLLNRLAQIDDPDVPKILEDLARMGELSPQREWLSHLADENVARHVDLPPWDPSEVRSFASTFEREPKTDIDLYKVACWRLCDIKREVEMSDNSLRDEVHRDWNERALRRWFQRKLMEPHRCRGRYTVPEEVEVDYAKRPDLRFENPHIQSAVPVEIKWADGSWTVEDLLRRLEDQLVAQYMRAHNVRYGIYLLAYIGNKTWRHPSESRTMHFEELVGLVERRAREIESARTDIDSIQIIAFNFARGVPPEGA